MGQSSNAYHLNRYYELRKRIITYLGGRCVVCGTTEQLEVDHINPAEKKFHISKSGGRPWDDLEKELQKCQLLCKSCHTFKTLTNRDNGRGFRQCGTYSAYRGGCRCADCKKAYSLYIKKYTATTVRKTCSYCKRRVTKYEISLINEVTCFTCLNKGR